MCIYEHKTKGDEAHSNLNGKQVKERHNDKRICQLHSRCRDPKPHMSSNERPASSFSTCIHGRMERRTVPQTAHHSEMPLRPSLLDQLQGKVGHSRGWGVEGSKVPLRPSWWNGANRSLCTPLAFPPYIKPNQQPDPDASTAMLGCIMFSSMGQPPG